jgi:PAS domain S-box-containing protein
MKKLLNAVRLSHAHRGYPMVAFLLFFNSTVYAQAVFVDNSPHQTETQATSYLIVIGFLLALTAILFFIFHRRYNTIAIELKDITSELGTTRQRLTESGKELEQEQKEHKATSTRYQGILFDASVGMFQMDVGGNCTYVNTALQELSGLYPKKALKEGFASAIHPDDRETFRTAWKAFHDGDQPFNETFRFRFKKGRDIYEEHVACRANKIYNAKNEVESYIGWVTNVSTFHEQQLAQATETARYGRFVAETIEGYYKLVPREPIPLSPTAAKMASSIMETMVLVDCNVTFAAMYGAQPAELIGKAINELQGGCGPFKNRDTLIEFVENSYKFSDNESVRQDPNGTRLNLVNDTVGMIEGNKLVGIWGAQRNISHQKREQAELLSKVSFMRRILNVLPADVHVKDTRCRYLYASKKLADRTGIAQEEWIGKTVFEVIPGTSKDHDQVSVETMKSGKINRAERPYEVRGKSGWMETVQIPLVSDDGLVEGVVGLSLDISDRRKKEEDVRTHSARLEQQLKQTRSELTKTEGEYAKAASALSSAIQKLKLAEAQKTNRQHEYEEQLAQRKQMEKTLRDRQEELLKQQHQLEKNLARRLMELDAETDKRKKWEELLAIKEDELGKAESLTVDLQKQFEQESQLRSKVVSELTTARGDLQNVREELDTLVENRQHDIEGLNSKHQSEFDAENRTRVMSEKKLAKVEGLLQGTQADLQQMTEQHSIELEQEVAERKSAAEKLIQSMEELDELRQQFNERLETETKAIKQELAQKQIREKTLRQHEKDLEDRIKELEKTLHMKAKEYAEQLQAREGAEVQKQQIEQRLEQMTKRQKQLIERETQKLHLHIAEIRLEEIKLRKEVGDLQRQKESMEEQLHARNVDLKKTGQESQKTEAVLAETQARLKQLSDNQEKVVAEATEAVRKDMVDVRKSGETLKEQLEQLQMDKHAVEKNLEARTAELSKAAREYRKVVDAYKGSQAKIKQLAEEQDALLSRKTGELETQLKQLRQTEVDLRAQEQRLKVRVEDQQQRSDELTQNLEGEAAKRRKADEELQQLQTALESSQENADTLLREQTRKLKDQVERLSLAEESLKQDLEKAHQSIEKRDESVETMETERKQTEERIKEIELRLSNVREEHQAELKVALSEVKEISSMNGDLVDELNDALQEALNPVVKTTLLMEKAENISEAQKMDLVGANNKCRSLIDMMNYRSELTHLADGSENIKSAQCDLHGLMGNIDRQFSHRADTKKLFFAVSFAQYQTAHNVPKLVKTDEQKLQNVLSILLGYAIEQTDKGRLGLHATRKSSTTDNANIAFELAYTGRDKTDRLLSSIFGSEKDEGVIDLKYGLTLARRYIGMLDGEITLEYRDGGITSFTVQFPFKKVASEGIITSSDDEKKAGAA